VGFGYVNAIEVLHYSVSQHGKLPVLVQQVTELGIHFLKFACNENIVDHTKEEDKLTIESTMVQTLSMCSVLELERDNDQMVTDGSEARAFGMALEVLEDRNNCIGGK
jgi:hypothetical protein